MKLFNRNLPQTGKSTLPAKPEKPGFLERLAKSGLPSVIPEHGLPDVVRDWDKFKAKPGSQTNINSALTPEAETKQKKRWNPLRALGEIVKWVWRHPFITAFLIGGIYAGKLSIYNYITDQKTSFEKITKFQPTKGHILGDTAKLYSGLLTETIQKKDTLEKKGSAKDQKAEYKTEKRFFEVVDNERVQWTLYGTSSSNGPMSDFKKDNMTLKMKIPKDIQKDLLVIDVGDTHGLKSISGVLSKQRESTFLHVKDRIQNSKSSDDIFQPDGGWGDDIDKWYWQGSEQQGPKRGMDNLVVDKSAMFNENGRYIVREISEDQYQDELKNMRKAPYNYNKPNF